MEYNKKDIRDKYSELFENSLILFYVHDLEGNFLDANDIALKTLGYEKKEIPNLNFSTFFDEDQLQKAGDIVKEIIQSGTHKEPAQFKAKKKDGGFVWVEVEGALIYKDGKPYAIQALGRDITRQKLAEVTEKLRGEVQGIS